MIGKIQLVPLAESAWGMTMSGLMASEGQVTSGASGFGAEKLRWRWWCCPPARTGNSKEVTEVVEPGIRQDGGNGVEG